MRNFFIILLSCLSFLNPVIANERFYRNISEMGDYGSTTVTAIFKDSTGFVWMGTPGMVLRFDGVRVSGFPLPEPADRLTAITAVSEIPGRFTLIGTRRGGFMISADSTRCLPLPVMSDTHITSAVRLGGEKLLVGTSTGLRVYNGTTGTAEKIMLSNDVLSRSNFVTSLRRDNDRIYIATHDGIFVLDIDSGDIDRVGGDNCRASEISSIAVSGDTLLLGTATDGLLALDLRSGVMTGVDVGCNVVTSLDTDPDGYIYVGTDGKGVVRLDPATLRITDTITHMTNSAGTPQSNQVYSLLVDDMRLLWIGYYQHGADYTLNNFGAFEIYSDPRYFNSRGMAIRTITMDADYTTIGTREGLILIDRNRGVMQTFKRPALRSDMVISVLPLGGRYYIGTYGGGMYVLDPAGHRVSDFDSSRPDPFVNGHIFSITADRAGDMWVATSAGLFHYRGATLVKHYSTHNSNLPAGNVYEVFFDSGGKGWICTENGMAIYDNTRDEIRTDVFPEGFINREKIRVVYEDADHNLYFLPEKGPLTVSDINLTRFSHHDILGGADAKSIIQDSHGCIWITTDRGIMCWDRSERMPIRYGFADGIPSMNFTQCTPVIDPTGNLWFGNSGGLLRLSKHHSGTEFKAVGQRPVPVDILVEGKPYNIPSPTLDTDSVINIDFDSDYANVTVSLAAFSYTSPEAVTVEYRLDGDHWQPVDRNLDITLYNLSSGNHRLELRNSNDPSSVTVVNLSMPMSAAMKIIIALIVMALLMAAYIVVIKIVHRRQQLLEAARSTAQRLRRDTTPEPAMPEPAADEEAAEPRADAGEQRPAEHEKYRTSRLKTSECEEITRRMEQVIAERKPYTDPELKLVQLAEMVGVPGHKLSQVLSQHLNVKFYDYINRLRVDEFKQIAAGDIHNRYTLSAMAEKAGFNSRASFFRYFKELEGISPGEYIKSLEQ